MTIPELGVAYHGDSDHLGHRDAFHSPCVLVGCSSKLKPGQRVAFECRENTGWVVLVSGLQHYDGIVDPFLPNELAPLMAFWMFLRPGLVKNLTHNFTIGDETEDEAKRKNNIESEAEDYNDDYCSQDGC